MPSIDDLFAELTAISSKADTTNDLLRKIETTLAQGFQGLSTTLKDIFDQSAYSAQALYHIAQQDDSVICILEKISMHTCAILNEAHQETAAEIAIQRNVETIVDMYKLAHPDAAATEDRLERLQREVEECCPQTPPKPICTYEPCPAPKPIGEPPRTGVE